MELSSSHFMRGDTRLAEALLAQSLLALDSLPAGTGDADSVWLRRRILESLVRVLTSTGRYEEAVWRGEEALRMAEDLGHPAPIAWTLGRLGRVYCRRGEVDKAIALSSRSLALAQEREVHNVIQWSSASLGVAHTLGGRTTEAIARLEEAVAAGESTRSLDPYTLVSLGQAYLSAGRSEDASRCAQEALAMCRQRTRRDVEADALHLIGDLAARRERPDSGEAMAHYREALALAEPRGMRPLVAHCHLGLGKLYRRTDRREQAREHLATATTMYREMGMTYWLEKAEAEVRDVG
jgi:tetratricopeptide (TPR) repeat protein